jgi:hypothetical protein
VACGEHDNESSVCIICGEFLEKLCKTFLLKDSVPWI